jgi:hypothetical protein
LNGRERSLANLKPATSEDAGKRNPLGKNGRTQHEAFVSWMDEKRDGSILSRIGEVWGATLDNALTPKGGLDRKTLIEQYQGRARAQLDISNDDESLLPAILRVLAAPPSEVQPAKDEPKDDVG